MDIIDDSLNNDGGNDANDDNDDGGNTRVGSSFDDNKAIKN